MNALANERILADQSIHWAIFVPVGLFALISSIGGCLLFFMLSMPLRMLGAAVLQSHGALSLAAWMFAGFIALPNCALLCSVLVAFFRTRYRLTNQRLGLRSGLFFATSAEIPLSNIEAIVIQQPLLGQLLGYGTIFVTGKGGVHFPLRFISSAKTFYERLRSAMDASRAATIFPSKTSLLGTDQKCPPAAHAFQDDSRYMPKR